MQVTHVSDHVTHAMIGAKQTIDFGISNSAEFFNILSSTLYKNQRLAVVRETICNANDAHIEGGVTEAIEITLTNELFTIRDFGTGIHKDDMGTIYGTYGNSTKKNDGQQTGGFGLGCKAPFAYTDHFDVHSMHDGIKTVYNLSKSSAAAQGKPGITPILSIPTKETGLLVSIAVKNLADRHEFERLIRMIAYNGDMNITLNDEKLDTLGFDDQSDYLLTVNSRLIEPQTRIMVRYGHVIYPVDSHPNLEYLTKQIADYVGRMNTTHYLVLQAKPHTIAVTPSRETLSMQEHTINALKGLMESFLSQIRHGFDGYCKDFLEINIKQAVAGKDVPKLLSRRPEYPSNVGRDYADNIRNNEQFAHRFMSGHYPTDTDNRKRDWTIRLTEMSKAGMLDRGKVTTFLKELKKYKGNFDRYWSTPADDGLWFQRNITGPVMADLQNVGADPQRLYVYDREDSRRSSFGSYDVPLVPAVSARPTHLLNAASYLRNIVIVTGTKRDLMFRAGKHSIFKTMGDMQGVLLYHLGAKQKERQAALEYFKNSGMQVIDLSVRQDWEPEPVKRAPVAKVVKKDGWPALSSIVRTDAVTGNFQSLDFRYSKEEGAARVSTPEFVLNVGMSKTDNTEYYCGYDSRSLRTIVELWGDKGCITNNDTLSDKMIKLGAQPFLAYVQEKLLHHVTTDANMLGYWEHRAHFVVEDSSVDAEMVERIYANPQLRKEFGITFVMTPANLKILALYQRYVSSVLSSYEHNRPQQWKDANAIIQKIKPSPEAAAMVKRLASSPLLSLLDMDSFDRILGDKKTKQTVKDDALAVFNLLIN